MKKIGKLVKHIECELNLAGCYAEKYIECRADGDSQMANIYRDMAQNNMSNADGLHNMAVTVIDKIKAVYIPTPEMQEKWDETHRHYVEKATEIKRMLTM